MKKLLILLILIIPTFTFSQNYTNNDSILIDYFKRITIGLKFHKQSPINNLYDFNINTNERNRKIYFSKLTDTMYVGIAKNLKGISPLRDKKFKEYDYKYFVFDSKNIKLYIFGNFGHEIDTIQYDKDVIINYILLSAVSCAVYNKSYYIETYILIRAEPFHKVYDKCDILSFRSYKKDGNVFYRTKSCNNARMHGKYLEDNTDKTNFINYFNEMIMNNKNSYFDSDKVEWEKIDYSIYITKRAERKSKKCK